ncbi:hypothetical protein M514_05585 [Trichuris suis]|uniref:Uncharacterized protein n=1 Tax=Trichuris suis TaxID=68888 RepID=A0A085NQW0_9BILA|nr:hypothetical protein M513_05585 [Trichuris suis]KFD71856.1 hypothetical protein M514_05585 [Trichuris suis]
MLEGRPVRGKSSKLSQPLANFLNQYPAVDLETLPGPSCIDVTDRFPYRPPRFELVKQNCTSQFLVHAHASTQLTHEDCQLTSRLPETFKGLILRPCDRSVLKKVRMQYKFRNVFDQCFWVFPNDNYTGGSDGAISEAPVATACCSNLIGCYNEDCLLLHLDCE